jgi:hypothetical protein
MSDATAVPSAEQLRFEKAWAVVRDPQHTPGVILRQVNPTTVHFSSNDREVLFVTEDVAALEALTALLRGLAGR